MTTTTTKRTHLLYLTVDADTRRELRFADCVEGVEVYSFDGLDCGEEITVVLPRAEARAQLAATRAALARLRLDVRDVSITGLISAAWLRRDPSAPT